MQVRRRTRPCREHEQRDVPVDELLLEHLTRYFVIDVVLRIRSRAESA